jgi:hypothetical protein
MQEDDAMQQSLEKSSHLGWGWRVLDLLGRWGRVPDNLQVQATAQCHSRGSTAQNIKRLKNEERPRVCRTPGILGRLP